MDYSLNIIQALLVKNQVQRNRNVLLNFEVWLNQIELNKIK